MQTPNLDLLEEYFPFDHFRDGQRECIETILHAFNSGKKFVILEGPTGSGKSAIGLTIARYFQNSYYLTIQKILQDQLIRDFGGTHEIKALKGRNAYRCTYWENYLKRYMENPIKMKIMRRLANDPIINNTMINPNLSCDEGVCKVKDKNSKCGLCVPTDIALEKSSCPYWKALGEASLAPICLMNFSSFLYQTVVSPNFGPRELMILDEGHSVETQLMDFVSLSITDRRFAKWNIRFPKFDHAIEYSDFFDHHELHEKIAEFVRAAAASNNSREEKLWKKILLSYRNFQKGVVNGDWIPKWEDHGRYRKVVLKPIFVDQQAHECLFNYGQKVLLMSATILSPKVFYDSLGIDPKNAFAYRMKNRFPKNNRLIFFQPSGSMNYHNKHSTMPNLLNDVETISKEHHNQKGIIHTHNFEIADYIIQNSHRDLKSRLLYQRDFETKDEMLSTHKETTNSIIIAPAMHEGLDLKDDLSRFQIICKVPYPSFANNEQLKTRMNLSQTYYDWLAALKLVQSTGRSIRSETDWAITYILDADFKKFRAKAYKLLPKWFIEAIVEN